MKAGNPLPGLVINVPALANKPPRDVERVLGRPEERSTEIVNSNGRHMYKRGSVEVVFIEGRARWIKLYNPRHMRFHKHSLSKLGLPSRKPTYVNRKHVMSWSNLCNLREVSLYADSKGGVSSVLVCVRPLD